MGRGMDKEGVCVCVCVCMMECYSAIKKNETMPFAATQMGLESVILNEVTQTKEKYHDISYIWNLKRNGTNELTYKIERGSQT